MAKNWCEFVKYMINADYDTVIHLDDDKDDNCIYCPECREPIYEEDYPSINKNEDGSYFCPICEYSL